MRAFLLSTISLFAITTTSAQMTISNGKNILEISGGISAFYNWRSLKPGETDQSKNRFKLRDAQLELEGRLGSDFEFDLKADFADMAANSVTNTIDPENPGLLDASITYKGLDFMDVQLGYGKLYYSRSAMTPFELSPYWQSPELTRGSIFSTRDVGITLMKNFWKQRANIYLGAYTGLGELSLVGDNDPSGNLEYVGRMDVSYPARYRYREIDTRHTPIPMFSVGIEGRYMDKTLPAGAVFPTDAASTYGLKVIDGKRYVYGCDASFQYMGFSAQFEIHQIKAEPQHDNDLLFQNYTNQQTKGYVLAGGYIAQVNYFVKPLNLIASVRYEELDLNDLVKGNSQRLSPALGYQIPGYNAMIKAQFFKIFKEESIDPQKWEEQFRIGMVLNFK